VEILLIDAGSSDATVAIAEKLGVDRILPNPLITGEAGKSVGVKAAQGEFVLLLDSDNIITEPDWLARMMEPFESDHVSGSQPIRFSVPAHAGLINRWHALLGAADPVAFYVGNYDHQSVLSGRWTDMPHRCIKHQRWAEVALDPGFVPTMGANGFMWRKSRIPVELLGDYFFDIDAVAVAVRSGHDTFALVDVGIEHHFCDDTRGFWRKTKRRIDDFLFFRSRGVRSYEWEGLGRKGIARFILSTVLIAPVVLDAFKGFRRVPDRAWAFHPLACWITLFVYSRGLVLGAARPRMMDRRGWRQ
jgi:glycosyltransferase involved in cell wall biosynthesis